MRRLLFLIAFIGVIVSCKKTVEGESKNWEYNIKSANELMASYPQYKEAIQKQVEEAKGKMESAKKVSSEEERIKAMSEANNFITSGLIGEIQTYERTKNDLESQIRTLGQKPQAERDQDKKVDRAIDYAKDSKRRAEKLVNGESTSDIAEAQMRFKRATSELQTSLDFIKDIADRIDRKNAKREEKKAQNDGGGSDGGSSNSSAKVKEKPEDKMVKCEYCSNTVKFGNRKCPSCGAQLKLN